MLPLTAWPIVDRLGRFPTVGDRLAVDLPGGGRALIDVRALDRHVPDRVHIALREGERP
ncbi:hypothetical protein ABT330_03415 [Streptomyces sp. NPDC000658]|uniref:hypothetical protein n=1 Tax=Streptomyces sp. NPDC000658 TaxID=3154266 RepID=UPI003322E624